MSIGVPPLGALPRRYHSPHRSNDERHGGLLRRGLTSSFSQQQLGLLLWHHQWQSLLCRVVPVLFSCPSAPPPAPGNTQLPGTCLILPYPAFHPKLWTFLGVKNRHTHTQKAAHHSLFLNEHSGKYILPMS